MMVFLLGRFVALDSECVILIYPPLRSFFNFAHSGVPVGYVTFTRLRICHIIIISVDYFCNLPSMQLA
jgi:hypothetical protein